MRFANDWDRDENDWILFPQRDGKIRKDYVPSELWERVVAHPAKQNMFAGIAIVDYVNEPWEEVFLDPFGGIGTTMLTTVPAGNRCVLVEIESEYVGVATAIRDFNNWQDKVTIVESDNRLALPIIADHIITSPPYGADLYRDKETYSKGAVDRAGRATIEAVATESIAQYGQHPQNIGRLNNFYYVQEMKKLYKKMVDSIKPGGTISITHRDRIKERQRVLFSLDIVQALTSLGMKLEVFEKWLAPGSVQSRVNEAQGLEVVLDEDILIFRKPK